MSNVSKKKRKKKEKEKEKERKIKEGIHRIRITERKKDSLEKRKGQSPLREDSSRECLQLERLEQIRLCILNQHTQHTEFYIRKARFLFLIFSFRTKLAVVRHARSWSIPSGEEMTYECNAV